MCYFFDIYYFELNTSGCQHFPNFWHSVAFSYFYSQEPAATSQQHCSEGQISSKTTDGWYQISSIGFNMSGNIPSKFWAVRKEVWKRWRTNQESPCPGFFWLKVGSVDWAQWATLI